MRGIVAVGADVCGAVDSAGYNTDVDCVAGEACAAVADCDYDFVSIASILYIIFRERGCGCAENSSATSRHKMDTNR